MLKVQVPCADEAEFYARLADRIAANGIRVPSDDAPAVGSRARVALEFKDGGILAGEAVVEEHVELDARPAVKVRFLRLDRTAAPAPAAAPAAPPRPPRPTEAELALALFGDGAAGGTTGAFAFTRSTEIAAAVDRRAARFQRAAIVVAVLAVAVALAGVAIARWPGGTAAQELAATAHVKAADRLLAEGRLSGKDGALEHLLAARRLHPGDPETTRRLERLADMLERLAAGALERGDLAVASIHLASAREAAPDRRGLQALQDELERRAAPGAR